MEQVISRAVLVHGIENRNPPADGRGIPMIICKACRDSSVHHVAIIQICGDKGIRTPDLLHAMQTRYQLRHTPKRIATG